MASTTKPTAGTTITSRSVSPSSIICRTTAKSFVFNGFLIALDILEVGLEDHEIECLKYDAHHQNQHISHIYGLAVYLCFVVFATASREY